MRGRDGVEDRARRSCRPSSAAPEGQRRRRAVRVLRRPQPLAGRRGRSTSRCKGVDEDATADTAAQRPTSARRRRGATDTTFVGLTGAPTTDTTPTEEQRPDGAGECRPHLHADNICTVGDIHLTTRGPRRWRASWRGGGGRRVSASGDRSPFAVGHHRREPSASRPAAPRDRRLAPCASRGTPRGGPGIRPRRRGRAGGSPRSPATRSTSAIEFTGAVHAGRRRAPARAGHPAQQGHRHRPQLRRPRQGDGRRGARPSR